MGKGLSPLLLTQFPTKFSYTTNVSLLSFRETVHRAVVLVLSCELWHIWYLFPGIPLFQNVFTHFWWAEAEASWAPPLAGSQPAVFPPSLKTSMDLDLKRRFWKWWWSWEGVNHKLFPHSATFSGEAGSLGQSRTAVGANIPCPVFSLTRTPF